MTQEQLYADLGFDTPLQPHEYPMCFETARDLEREQKDLILREGELININTFLPR